MYTCQKLHFPERAFARNYFSPNEHFPENLFSRIDTCQNLQLVEIISTEYAFSKNYLFSKIHYLEIIFHSKNYTMFKQNKLLVEIKKRYYHS